jgi:peptidoglycan/LPS O-acetylase OafA/YrhL
MRPAEKNLTFESFRGLAALAVVLHHLAGMGLGPLPRTWGQLGGHGVDLFFALSGFLIARCVLVPERFAWQSYLASRTRRIFPAYLASLLILVTVADARWLFEPGWPTNLLAHVTLLHAWFGGGIMEAINGPYWTLSHEWTFYVLMALLALPARSRTGFWAVAIGMLVIGLTTRWLAWRGMLPLPNDVQHPVARWDQFAGGMIAARVAWNRPGSALGSSRIAWWGCVLAGTGLVTACLWQTYQVVAALPAEKLTSPNASQIIARAVENSRGATVWGPFLLAVGFGAWCFAGWTAPARLSVWLGRTPLPWMGRVSYSTYLWHVPVLSAVLRATTRRGAPVEPWTAHPWVALGGLLAIVYLLSWVSFRGFEEPFMRRRKE